MGLKCGRFCSFWDYWALSVTNMHHDGAKPVRASGGQKYANAKSDRLLDANKHPQLPVIINLASDSLDSKMMGRNNL